MDCADTVSDNSWFASNDLLCINDTFPVGWLDGSVPGQVVGLGENETELS